MKDYQARGYIFEEVVWDLLKKSGYVDVNSKKLRGRGADHQIDAFGTLILPSAFIHPIRLISECKCYKSAIELHLLRNFVGVIKDISENYVIPIGSTNTTEQRYTDIGCFFSATEFTSGAQTYAWAHNIFLVSFANVPALKPQIESVISFVNALPKSTLKNETKESLVSKYRNVRSFGTNISQEDQIAIKVGSLNGLYPIILAGSAGWESALSSEDALRYETIHVEKAYRIDNTTESTFVLYIAGNDVAFSLPNAIAAKIVQDIDNADAGSKIFSIDVANISNQGEYVSRRYVTINVYLPYEDFKTYLCKLHNVEGTL